jgi:hypothetical protein
LNQDINNEKFVDGNNHELYNTKSKLKLFQPGGIFQFCLFVIINNPQNPKNKNHNKP